MEHTDGEIKRLKACINDLISVLALPAIWSGHEPSQIVGTLLDVLLGMLRLDFVYARLSDSIGGGAPIEMVRAGQGRNSTAQPQEIGQALNPWLAGDPGTPALVMLNPIGEGEVLIAPLRLGLQDELGVLIAGSQRANFPTDTEMLLLRVAANQAGIGLQEARLLSEQKRAAQELEQRVLERTRQLTAVNEELRKEIIERKRADAELRESERRYRYIFQSTGVSIWEEDFSQVKIAIDDLKAKGVQDFRQYLVAHPEFVEQAISMVKILDVNEATVELFGAHDKHELLATLDKVFTPETREVFAGELIALADGRTWFQSQASLKTLKGDRISVVFTITFPTESAKLNSVLVSIIDTTEQKRAEEALHKAQAELAHVTRVMTIGELVASIAHEVNQPLGAIVTNGHACVRLLSREVPDVEKSLEVIRRMIGDGMRASEVIKRIRDLLHKAPPEKGVLNINETIEEVIALVSSDVLRSKVEVLAELAADLPPVVGDQIQLQQVILNLILNAKDAMSGMQNGPRELLITSRKSKAGELVVAVRDSGKGLDAKDAERIFEPFFTTKPEGMGLGLSISRTIIEAHGGTLWATPNEDKGATVQFSLPPSSGSQS